MIAKRSSEVSRGVAKREHVPSGNLTKGREDEKRKVDVTFSAQGTVCW